MAINKITEKPVAALSNDAHVLVTQTVEENGQQIEGLRRIPLADFVAPIRDDFDAVINITDHYTEYNQDSPEVSLIDNTYYTWQGVEKTGENTDFYTLAIRIAETSRVRCIVSSTMRYCVVFDGNDFSDATYVQGWDKNIWPTEPFTVEAEQYVAVSARHGANVKILVAPLSERTVTIKPSVLPKLRIDPSSLNLGGIASVPIPTDALLYADRLPSYYIDRPANPASFQDAMGYIDRKIAAIPKHGKQFIFIADTHWAGNKKHSTDLIQYVRKRTGIRKVVFGGDVFGGYNTKYEAAAVAADYLNQAKRAFGRDLIPTMGDHDNNTVNAPADAFLPYSVISPLFVDTLERTEDFHCCQPGEKLSQFATVGSEDYNEALEFFKTVYYVDDNQDKIRYISLNCGNNGDRGAMYNIFGESGASLLRLQLHWLADTLMHTPTGYDVIVICHKLNYGFAGTAGKALEALLTLFLRKEPGTVKPIPSTSTEAIDAWIPRSTTFDFSEAPDIGRLICLMGHTHYDSLSVFGQTNGAFAYDAFVSSGTTITQYDHSMEAQNLQIPIINTTTDSLGAINTGTAPSGAVIPPMATGTVTEQAFDVVTLTDDAIIMTRFGAGDDRILYINRPADDQQDEDEDGPELSYEVNGWDRTDEELTRLNQRVMALQDANSTLSAAVEAEQFSRIAGDSAIDQSLITSQAVSYMGVNILRYDNTVVINGIYTGFQDETLLFDLSSGGLVMISAEGDAATPYTISSIYDWEIAVIDSAGERKSTVPNGDREFAAGPMRFKFTGYPAVWSHSATNARQQLDASGEQAGLVCAITLEANTTYTDFSAEFAIARVDVANIATIDDEDEIIVDP